MVLGCVALHVLFLKIFVDQSAFIELRPDRRRAPVQIEILAEPAEKPAEPLAALPKASEPAPKVVRKPVYRPKPVQLKPTPPPVAAAPAQDGAQAVNSVDNPDLTAGASVTDNAAGAISSDSASDSTVRASNGTAAQTGNEGGITSSGSGGSASANDAAATPLNPLRYGKALPAAPPSGKWTYSVHMGEFDQSGSAGTLKLGYENLGSTYSVRAEVSATGITAFFYGGVRRDMSRGHLGLNGFEPERYVEQRNKGGERTSEVDRAGKQIRFAGGDAGVAPDGLQDRLSSLFQLGLMARAEPSLLVTGAIVEIPEMNLRDVETIRYRVNGPTELKIPLGVVRTLHLSRLPGIKGKDTEIDLWLDYDFGMMPIRIRLTDPNGRVIDQVLDAR